jgi:DNA-binding NtrC family response regulator
VTQSSPAQHILVVDEYVARADVLAMVLSHEGYRVSSAHTGKAAVLCAVEETPDLLITSLALPGWNGLELAKVFREHFPECRILVHTGTERTHLSVSTTSEGFHLLDTPIRVEDLLSLVDAVWKNTATGEQR